MEPVISVVDSEGGGGHSHGVHSDTIPFCFIFRVERWEVQLATIGRHESGRTQKSRKKFKPCYTKGRLGVLSVKKSDYSHACIGLERWFGWSSRFRRNYTAHCGFQPLRLTGQMCEETQTGTLTNIEDLKRRDHGQVSGQAWTHFGNWEESKRSSVTCKTN